MNGEDKIFTVYIQPCVFGSWNRRYQHRYQHCKWTIRYHMERGKSLLEGEQDHLWKTSVPGSIQWRQKWTIRYHNMVVSRNTKTGILSEMVGVETQWGRIKDNKKSWAGKLARVCGSKDKPFLTPGLWALFPRDSLHKVLPLIINDVTHEMPAPWPLPSLQACLAGCSLWQSDQGSPYTSRDQLRDHDGDCMWLLD